MSDSERVTVPTHLLGREGGSHYVLRVVGDEQAGEGVLDGDFVVVRTAETARDGELAVCLIGDETTLKRVFYGAIHLPLRLPADKIKILGVVTGLMRKYA